MQKIQLYIIISLLIISGVLGGVLFSSSGADAEMDYTIKKLEAENSRLTSNLGRATDKAGQLNNKIGELRTEITGLRKELDDFNVGFGDIGTGLSDIESGVSGVLEEMLRYTEKAGPQE